MDKRGGREAPATCQGIFHIQNNAEAIMVFSPNQIKSATDNIGIFSPENDDIQMFISQSSLPKGEFSKLESALITKYGNKEEYGAVITTADYEYTVNYKGGGEFDIIEYHLIDNNINDYYNERERENFQESPDRWSSRNGFTEGEYNSSSYHVTKREANGYNAGLDQETLQGEPDQTTSDAGGQEHQGTGQVKTGFDGTNNPRYTDTGDLSFFLTPEGELYGFVDKEGNIYLDETVIDPEHPVHEYTHLWDRIVAKKHPRLWKRGVELFRQTSLWEQIANDTNYGLKWKQMGDMPQKMKRKRTNSRKNFYIIVYD